MRASKDAPDCDANSPVLPGVTELLKYFNKICQNCHTACTQENISFASA